MENLVAPWPCTPILKEESGTLDERKTQGLEHCWRRRILCAK
jgi:hypothetical protein